MTKRSLQPESTVFVSAAGWRDCDTSLFVIATTAKGAEREICRMMREEARHAVYGCDSGYKTISDALDDIAWYGVSQETLSHITSDAEREEIIADLNASGFAYPELP